VLFPAPVGPITLTENTIKRPPRTKWSGASHTTPHNVSRAALSVDVWIFLAGSELQAIAEELLVDRCKSKAYKDEAKIDRHEEMVLIPVGVCDTRWNRVSGCQRTRKSGKLRGLEPIRETGFVLY